MYRLEPSSPSLNVIIQSFNDVGLSSDDVEILVPAIPSLIKVIQSAKIENKLALLSGDFVGKENEVYVRDECLDQLIKYIEALPHEITEAKKKKIILDAEKQVSK